MNVSEIGETGLISRISAVIDMHRNPEGSSWKNLALGVGDDAAAWYTDDSIQLATVDALRQGTHFELATMTWHALGWKALAVNLSDIAAMGGLPRYALVSLQLPPETDVENVVELYEGMGELARKFDVAIVGGDIDRGSLIEVGVTVFGITRTREQPLLLRSNAVAGDRIAVTGYLGGAAAGLKMLSKKLSFDRNTTNTLQTAFQRPSPRVAEGKALVDAGVKTAIDISDGLVADLGRICRASCVGARINADKIPVSPDVRSAFGKESFEMALSGGEDYELLFTGSDAAVGKVQDALSCPVTVIGDIVPGKEGIVVTDTGGTAVLVANPGWEHFKKT